MTDDIESRGADTSPVHRSRYGFAELLANGRLESHLAEVLRKAGMRSCSVAASNAERRSCVQANGSGEIQADVFGARLKVGCLSKLFTAALARQLIVTRSLSLDTPLAELLASATGFSFASMGPPVLIQHLLEHTHGLDGSAISEVPRDQHGGIDADRLCAQLLSAGSLAPPGSHYNYGSAGAWLMAGVLERLSGSFYVDLLRNVLGLGSGPVSSGPSMLDPREICPSRGQALRVCIGDLLSFAESQAPWMLVGRSRFVGMPVKRLPGWSPLEKGICLAWKYYGMGWFGHDSLLEGESVLLRVNVREPLVVVIVSDCQTAESICSAAFNGLLPAVRFRPRRSVHSAVVDNATVVGTYRNAATSIEVGADEAAALRLRVCERTAGKRSGEVIHESVLHHSAGSLYFPAQRSTLLPFVQFLPRNDFPPKYLWNGRSIWKRCD